MKTFQFVLTVILIFSTLIGFSQGVRISTDNLDPDPSSILDIVSTSKGVLVPRMSATQRTAISTPAIGLLVYQTDGTSGFYYFNGSWVFLSQPNGAAGGSLSGNYPNPGIAGSVIGSTNIIDGSITNIDISNTAAIASSKISGLGTLAALGSVSGGTGGTITDGTITNADVSTGAGISGTKISPSFTSQWVTMTETNSSGQSRLQYTNDLGTAGISLFGSTFGASGNIMRFFNNTHPTDGGAMDFITDGIIRFYIGDSPNQGYIGIGTTSPNYRLDVRGTIGNNATLYHSDIRWKKDVKRLDGALDKIMKLEGVYFKWRKDEFIDMRFDDRRHIGFIAQEVEKIVPEFVRTAADGYKSVEYANVSALLIEALKEQQAIIEDLEERLKAIEQSNLEIEANHKVE